MERHQILTTDQKVLGLNPNAVTKPRSPQADGVFYSTAAKACFCEQENKKTPFAKQKRGLE